ncbi:DUF2125 domain-containing protein [Sedimentitalea todarodis]|uniref:DUF2125 domain-containing protein n=1 Tax=Sedimentitalea todarodis TaxID=1631240 RepID=A0ABU3VD69_9RHOB|nr:DUF2125 domain-containing protein [Sedimentitalea todarodis]MDU9004118.1 DUF2125 domain-containing protein [Sedimentitalea todarodis]
MTARFTRGLGAAVVYVLVSQAANADMMAGDVWKDWQDYLASNGYSVTGDEQSTGGSLTISDVLISMPIPDTEGSFAITMDNLTFTENGDGTVDIAMPDTIPLSFDARAEGEEPVSGVLNIAQSDTAMTASGSPGDVTYVYASQRVSMELASLTVNNEPMPASMLQMLVTMDKVESMNRLLTGDLRSFSQQMSADTLTYDIAFDDPNSEDMGSVKGAMQDIRTDSTGAMPLEMDPADFNATLEAGFAVDATLSYSAGNANILGVGDGETFAFDSSSQGGKLVVKMDENHIAYDVKQEQTSITMKGGELPVPVEIAAALSAFNFSMPIQKSDDDQDFAFGLNLSEFTMSDVLWSMIDPAAQLPRDPATVVLDAVGKGRMLFNLLDPEEAALIDQSGTPPAEISALTINKLLVSLVGASLSGTGDFTFDNTDTTTMDGFPKPTGYLDLKLVGANALLDKLSSMGLIADEEAMGARMMMGLLAVPGDEPDTLNSKIEINDQGHIMANGQRIQ